MEELFVKFNKLNRNNYIILKLDLNFTKLTHLQWELFKYNLESNLRDIDNNFVLVFNFINIDLLSKKKIKEIVDIFYKVHKTIENRLFFTIGICNNKIIETIFEIVKLFYKTKKPVYFLKNINDLNNILDKNITSETIPCIN